MIDTGLIGTKNTVIMSSILAFYEPTQVRLTLPFFEGSVPAGFPSPAADYVQKRLSTDDLLIHDATATFFVKALGDSMRDAGIIDGTVLVVDAGKSAQHGDIVVARIDGGYTVKRLILNQGCYELHPENVAANYPILQPTEELQIFGVVVGHVYVHHKKPGLRL